MRLFSFKGLRILLLFSTLLLTAFYTLHQYQFSRAWNKTLQVVVFPINGDGSEMTDRYIRSLTVGDFSAIDRWMRREARRYELLLEHPTQVQLGPEVDSLPPMLSDIRNPIQTVWWGLKMRWWAATNTPDDMSNLERVRMFVIFQQGKKGEALPHSLGLQKGLLGVVYAFSDKRQAAQNNIVIGHELLHTVGAIDKYDNRGMPVFPEGFADPDRVPLYPQRKAEIMAGHRPLASNRSTMPRNLKSVVINPFTAREINWIR